MGSEIASLFVTIGANVQGLVKGTTDAKTSLKNIATSFQSATGISLGFTSAAGAAAMAVKALRQELKKEEAAANESNIADAKLLAVYEATGAAVNLTRKQLDELATQVSKNAGVDDELVKSAEAVLMTFKGINGGVFSDTIKLAQDMAAVLGGDLQDKVQLLGKSLTGFDEYTKLQRTLGGFTDEQEASIQKFKESNDLVGYQNYLLKILQERYGGAAKKINEASDGQNDLNIAIENYREEVGKDLPVLTRKWNEYWTAYYNKSTDAIKATRDYKDQLDELNITYDYAVEQGGAHFANFMRDGTKLTQEQVDALIALANAADISADRYDKMAGEFVAAENKMSEGVADNYENMYSYLDQFMDMTDMSADEVEKATQRIILQMMYQQAMIDGELSPSEFDYLTKMGVQWGIYSDSAVAGLKKAYESAQAYMNMLNSMPSQKTITIVTNYVSSHPQGYVPATGSTMHAAGGSYQLSPFAGYEGVSLGAGQTAGGNEVVNVSNQNQINDMTNRLTDAINLLQNLPAEMKRSIRDGMLQGAA